MLEEIAKGLIIGLLVGILLLYSLRPKVPYPTWMTIAYDQPWIFIILFGLSIYTLAWDRLIGSLMLIIVAALFADNILLVREEKPVAQKNLQDKRAVEQVLAPMGFAEEVERDTINTEGPSPPLIPMTTMNYPMFAFEEELQPGHPAAF